MKHFKNSERYYPEGGEGLLYHRDENGQCWYEARKEFHPDTLKVTYDPKTMKVISFSHEADRIHPHDGWCATEFEHTPENFNFNTWKVDLVNHTLYECPDLLAERHENKKNFFIKKVITRASELSLFASTDKEKEELQAIRDYVAKIRSMPIDTKDDEWPLFTF